VCTSGAEKGPLRNIIYPSETSGWVHHTLSSQSYGRRVLYVELDLPYGNFGSYLMLEIGVRVPVGQEFSLLRVIHTGSGAHPASYIMGTEDSFPGGKAAGV
jgi:hypothetical protein